ncbi:hypothetical protein [Actinophytocola sp.]|uniref:hypothetical protein n=1 Tax=Actinophytocola sp. TaxID=1872138 RepID=UPI0038999AFE
MGDRESISRVGTARALVLLGAGLATGGTLLLCLLTVVFVPRIALATAVLAAFTLVSAITATLLTIRARTLPRVVGVGCGTVLAGVLVGLAVMLVLISRIAGNTA